MLPDGCREQRLQALRLGDGIAVDTRATCGGSRCLAIDDGNAADFSRPWTGECPSCSGRFELLYGGFLPDHTPRAEAPPGRDD